MTNPTMGGVSASLALGDIHIAEPNALIGFAGPRVMNRPYVRNSLKGSNARFLLEKAQ